MILNPCTFLMGFFGVVGGLTKPNKLTMLVITPARQTMDGRSCSGAMQIAIEAVNANPGILPDYEIVPVFREEGVNANLVPKTILDFTALADNSTVNLAPVFVGSFSFCQHSSRLSTYFKMVQFSYGCTAAVFSANRIDFPNLYRAMLPAEETAMTGTYFSKYIAGWNQVGMLTFAGNSNEYPSNKKVYISTVQAGIKFVIFTSELDVDDAVIQAFKESGARGIAVGTANVAMVVKFLCMAYDAGMRPPRYVFLITSFAYVSPDTVRFFNIPGCNRDKIIDQFRHVLWVGAFLSAVEYTGKSSLGYDMITLDTKLNALLNGSKPLDYAIRHACHDSTLQALIVLDNSEKKLRAEYNKTLLDFKSDPDFMMQVVNSTAAETSFRGIRVGLMKYSKRLEMDYEATWTMQAVNGTPRLIYKIEPNISNAAPIHQRNLSDYQLKVVQEPIWFTESGKPPKDLSAIVQMHYSYPDSAFYVGIVTWALFTVSIFGFIRGSSHKGIRSPDPLKFATIAVQMGSLTALLSSLLTLLFYYKHNYSTVSMQKARVILGTLGLSAIIGGLFGKIWMMHRAGNELQRARTAMSIARWAARNSPMPAHRVKTSSQRSKASRHREKSGDELRVNIIDVLPSGSSSSFRAASSMSYIMEEPTLIFDGKFVALGLFVPLSFVSLVLIAWFESERFRSLPLTSPVAFDVEMDAYYETVTPRCGTENDFAWISAIAAVHIVLLAISSFYAYILRNYKSGRKLRIEFLCTRLVVINTTVIFFCVTFLLAVVDEDQTTLQASVYIFGVLILASSSSFISFYPSIHKTVRVTQPKQSSRLRH